MEDVVWVLGHGPVVIHKQFRIDVHRCVGKLQLNGALLPGNVYAATRIIFETCEHYYYIYTKYMNQTIGNMIVEHLHSIFENAIVPVQSSYRIHAVYKKDRKVLVGHLDVCIVEEETKLCTLVCNCIYDVVHDKKVILYS